MKSEGSMAALTRRQYPEEFKQEAVRLVRDSARPVAQVARRLGTSLNTSRCFIIGRVGIPLSAMTPQPSMKQGQQSLNQVSTELGEGRNVSGVLSDPDWVEWYVFQSSADYSISFD